MRLGFRLLIGYMLILVMACYLVFTIFLKEVKPTVSRATEETMIDTATLLSNIVSQDTLSLNKLPKGSFIKALKSASHNMINTKIDGIVKDRMVYRLYITNRDGIVIFDSTNRDVGKDYSRWNDVYLTLRGKYGARSTREDPNDPTSSVMYVASPIKIDNHIAGVLTIAKPTKSMSMVVDMGERQILVGGGILVGLAMLIGSFFIWWINRSINKLVNYAHQVSNHKETPLPKLDSPELKTLALALDHMRLKLNGKDYIEKYVHTLAHELKSPLASIQAATEILQDTQNSDKSIEQIKQIQNHFLNNIDKQSIRMAELIDRMLQLVKIENRVGVDFKPVNTQEIINEVVEQNIVKAEQKNITLSVKHIDSIMIEADRFLLIQALNNLISNSLDFTLSGGSIFIQGDMQSDHIYRFTVTDTGEGIPDYALTRLYERFYSLPRPNNQDKSSGLGLAFVKEIALLHHGEIIVNNRDDKKGVIAQLCLNI